MFPSPQADARNNVPQKVLVIDDSRTIHLMVRSCLADENIELIFASNGAEGLSLARSALPDLILLDVEMPGLGGGEVAKALAEDPALRSIPILFVTSLLSKNDSGSACVRRGDHLYLPKLVEPNALIGAVEQMLAEPQKTD